MSLPSTGGTTHARCWGVRQASIAGTWGDAPEGDARLVDRGAVGFGPALAIAFADDLVGAGHVVELRLSDPV